MNYGKEIQEIENALAEWEINGFCEDEPIPYLINFFTLTKKMQEEIEYKQAIINSKNVCIKELLKKQKDTWIPCSDTLPEKRGWYICTFQSMEIVYSAYYDGDGRWQCDGIIVAWMPSPQPYKGDA